MSTPARRPRPPLVLEPFADCSRPSFAAMEVVHRAAESVVVVAKGTRTGDALDLEFFGAWRLDDFGSVLPLYGDDCEVATFYNLNGRSLAYLTRERAKNGKRNSPGKYADIARLCALFVDLDFGRDGAGFWSAVDRLADLDAPSPSLVVDSGRGAWALWLLADRDDLPPVATAEALDVYRAAQAALVGRAAELEELHVDQVAVDATRFTRMPGSLHELVGRRVTYFRVVHPGDGGRVRLHDLHDLAGALGVRQTGAHRRLHARKRPKQRPSRAHVDASQSAKGESGWRAVWHRRRETLLQLEAIRGGFRVGHRNCAVLFLARSLRCLRVPMEDALTLLTPVAERCHAPSGRRQSLPRRELVKAVRQSYKAAYGPRTFPSWETVAARLRVTPDEESALIDLGLGPPVWTRPGTRNARRDARRALLAEWVRPGARWTLRGLAEALAEHDLRASPETIRADLLALDLRTGREHDGPEQGVLPTGPR